MKHFLFAIIFLSASQLIVNANTYVVTNTNNAGSGSLRDAIVQSETNPGHDFIHFNIQPAGPVHTITLLTFLPRMDDPAGVTIDGYTQHGANPGPNPPSTAILSIVIDGSQVINMPPNPLNHYNGFFIRSSNNVIKGLVIQNFPDHGIVIAPENMQVAFNNHIYGNFIGTDDTGTLPGFGNGKYGLQFPQFRFAGITISTPPVPYTGVPVSRHNLIERNLIADNFSEGVSIVSSPPGQVDSNTVRGNYIGTAIDGMSPIGNWAAGVYLGEATHDNLVDSNLISSNHQEGVSMTGAYVGPDDVRITYGNKVFYNIIGLAIDRQTPLGNLHDGVAIGAYGNTSYGFAQNNWVHGNLISHNLLHGVEVSNLWLPGNPNSFGNKITTNSMHNNLALGIDLGNNGVTSNDMNDIDQGANEQFNFPQISLISFDYSTLQTSISGTTDNGISFPSARFVELFAVHPDPSGHGEGHRYLGRTVFLQTVNNWNIIVSGVYPGEMITATVTDSTKGNTSEFSTNVLLTGMPFNVIPTAFDPSCAGGNDGSITLNVVGGSGLYNYIWSTGATSQNIFGLSSGNYSVTASDHLGLSLQHSFVLVDPLPVDPNTLIIDATCSTCADGSVSSAPTGGTPPYQFLWSTGASVNSIGGLMPGTYCLTVTDGNMCTSEICDTVSFITSIESIDQNDRGLLIFPNPSSGTVNVRFRTMQKPELIRLFSATGVLVRETAAITDNEIQVPLKDLAPGTYVITFYWEDSFFVSRRIVVLE